MTNKKELIDFLNWFRTEVNETTMIDSDYFVDKYLKSIKSNTDAKKVCDHNLAHVKTNFGLDTMCRKCGKIYEQT